MTPFGKFEMESDLLAFFLRSSMVLLALWWNNWINSNSFWRSIPFHETHISVGISIGSFVLLVQKKFLTFFKSEGKKIIADAMIARHLTTWMAWFWRCKSIKRLVDHRWPNRTHVPDIPWWLKQKTALSCLRTYSYRLGLIHAKLWLFKPVKGAWAVKWLLLAKKWALSQ